MAKIYDEEVVPIYDGEEPSKQEPESTTMGRAAYTVLSSKGNGPDLGKQVAETKRQMSYGRRSDIDLQVEQQAVTEFENTKAEERVRIAVSDKPVEDKASDMDRLNDITYEPNLIDETYVNQASQYNPPTVNADEMVRERVGEQLGLGVANKILSDVEFSNEVSQMSQQLKEEMGGGTAEGVVEFVEAIAPVAIPLSYTQVANDLFPEDRTFIGSFVGAGETMEFIGNKFSSMSQEDRDIMLPRLKESLKEHAGLVTDNGYIASTMLNEIFSTELNRRGTDDFNWDRMWNNVVGVLDATFVAGIAARLGGKAIKATTRFLPQAAIDSANPEAARDIRALILSRQDTTDLEAAVGVNTSSVVTDLYPTFDGAINSLTPGGVVDRIAGMQTELKRIEDDLAFGINYTQQEQLVMKQRVMAAYDGINGSYNQSFSKFGVTEEAGKGFTVKAAIGPSTDTGFGGYTQAMEHFKRNFPEGTPVDFVIRVGDTARTIPANMLEEIVDETQNLRTYSRKADAKRGAGRAGFGDAALRQVEGGRWTWDKPQTEVWYRVEDTYTYNLSLLDENLIMFGGPTFDKGFVTGGLQSVLGDPATKFSRFINKASMRANDIGESTKGRMFDMYQRGFLKPLNREGHLKVLDIVKEGSRTDKNFTYDELIGKGLTNDQAVGYYTVRGVMDLEWALNNTRVYNTLKRDGYQSVINGDRGFETFARPLPRESLPYTSDKIDVFNPSSQSISRMSRSEVDYLYDNGGQVFKSKTAHTAGDKTVTYVVSGIDDATRVRPLRRNPLEYRPGYVTRFYDENYFVKMKVNKTIDGVKGETWRTVAAVPTNSDGVRLMDELRLQNDGVDFDVFPDQKMTSTERFDNEFDYLHSTGGIITGRRGDHLRGIGEAQAELLDPVQSMIDSISYTAARISHDDLIAGFEKRWVNTYGRKMGLDSIPANLNEIKGATFTANGIQEAKELARYIQGMRGVQGEWGLKWRGFMAGLAESMENTLGGGRKVKQMGDHVRGFNPVKSLRGMTFNILIASNPARQILLQANQVSFLSGMRPKYFASGRAGQEFAAFMGAAGMRQRPQWGKYRDGAAKMLKMPPKDFELMYDAFVRSGLPQSIDSHTYARDGLQQLSKRITGTWGERAGRTAINAVKLPMLASKRVGFDAGEWSNVTMTYLTARNDWIAKNPGLDWRTFAAMDDIGTEARDLALNMTKSGELPYQKGVLSLATQFLSYQHKALLATAGAVTGKYGNKAFAGLPAHQRASFVVAQFAMYGADGFGAGAMIDKITDNLELDVPAAARPFIDGLFYEYMLNGVINSVTSEDSNIDFSSTLAPASGINESFTNLIGRAMTMDLPDVFLGASGSMLGRISDAYMNINIALEIPDLTKTETIQAVLQQGGQVFGGYNNYVKGQVMQKMGYYVSNSGNPLFETTYAEGLAKSLFGINPEAMDDYYRILEATSGGFASKGIADTVSELTASDVDSIAEKYYERVSKIYRELGAVKIESRDDLWYNQLEAKMALENTLFAILPEDVGYAVRKRISERIDRNLNDTGFDQLIDYMTTTVLEGNAPQGTIEHYLGIMDNSEIPMTTQQRQDVQTLIDYVIDEGQ